jgi:hypothetical protein
MSGDAISATLLEALNEQRCRQEYAPYANGVSACSILHPEHSNCFTAAGYFIFHAILAIGSERCCDCHRLFFLNALKRTVPVYVPVYFLPLFIFKASVISLHVRLIV